MAALSAAQQVAAERLLEIVGPLRVRFCPLGPNARQEAFLRLRLLEALFGGAAGGGKSVALLMAALQYCDVPGYHALIVRPTLAELEIPGGLITLAHDWLSNTKAAWSGDQRAWRFPGNSKTGAGGASLRFGYLDGPRDVYRYSGSSFSFLGFDELTRFTEDVYRRMFRVVRQATSLQGQPAAQDGTTLDDVPVRVRATSNPGGPGHGWVKSYFVDPETRADGARFLPSRMRDNPALDSETYIATLAHLSHAERERLLNGDWNIPDEGDLFQRHWFEQIDRSELPPRTRAVRFWDLAATEPSAASPDPDYTVGLKLELDDRSGIYYISGLSSARKSPATVEGIVRSAAESDGRAVQIIIEQEPAASGVSLVNHYKRSVLAGYNVRSERPTGPKHVRAQVVAAAAENGLVKLVRGPHSSDFLDEVAAFPHAPHDDYVDALTGAHQALSRSRGTLKCAVPRGSIYDSPSSRRGIGRRESHGQLLLREREESARLASQLGIPHHGG
jgi:predicted phage terminase large subunit-like protein